ncbi:nitroreductase family protein [Rhodoferax sp. GW822-FHT02A01]|uniref:nitroreductase family protein n=1 Tax=Rhodoferax sp. GW822-FHT02A01 TaxID=3141537 RepID=UPI00315CB692
MHASLETMALRDAIQGRRSVRTFGPEQIERTTLLELLELAVQAPTAMHLEPWGFIVVQDKKVLQRISEQALSGMADLPPSLHRDQDGMADVFHGAPTLVVICAPSAARFSQADCWLAAQNLMLGAYAMGLGTCVIGMSVATLNSPPIRALIGLPPDVEAVAPIIVGQPLAVPPAVGRKAPRIASWIAG